MSMLITRIRPALNMITPALMWNDQCCTIHHHLAGVLPFTISEAADDLPAIPSTVTLSRSAAIGSPSWIRTTIAAFKVRHPAVGRRGTWCLDSEIRKLRSPRDPCEFRVQWLALPDGFDPSSAA
jgi:hypothetical protein